MKVYCRFPFKLSDKSGSKRNFLRIINLFIVNFAKKISNDKFIDAFLDALKMQNLPKNAKIAQLSRMGLPTCLPPGLVSIAYVQGNP